MQLINGSVTVDGSVPIADNDLCLAWVRSGTPTHKAILRRLAICRENVWGKRIFPQNNSTVTSTTTDNDDQGGARRHAVRLLQASIDRNMMPRPISEVDGVSCMLSPFFTNAATRISVEHRPQGDIAIVGGQRAVTRGDELAVRDNGCAPIASLSGYIHPLSRASSAVRYLLYPTAAANARREDSTMMVPWTLRGLASVEDNQLFMDATRWWGAGDGAAGLLSASLRMYHSLHYRSAGAAMTPRGPKVDSSSSRESLSPLAIGRCAEGTSSGDHSLLRPTSPRTLQKNSTEEGISVVLQPRSLPFLTATASVVRHTPLLFANGLSGQRDSATLGASLDTATQGVDIGMSVLSSLWYRFRASVDLSSHFKANAGGGVSAASSLAGEWKQDEIACKADVLMEAPVMVRGQCWSVLRWRADAGLKYVFPSNDRSPSLEGQPVKGYAPSLSVPTTLVRGISYSQPFAKSIGYGQHNAFLGHSLEAQVPCFSPSVDAVIFANWLNVWGPASESLKTSHGAISTVGYSFVRKRRSDDRCIAAGNYRTTVWNEIVPQRFECSFAWLRGDDGPNDGPVPFAAAGKFVQMLRGGVNGTAWFEHVKCGVVWDV